MSIFSRMFGSDKSTASDNPGDKLYIGMSFDEIVRLLGKPSGINPGTEMLEAGPGSVVVASEQTRAKLARTQYCMWKRPEGRYLLIIEDNKLAKISERPSLHSQTSQSPAAQQTQQMLTEQGLSKSHPATPKGNPSTFPDLLLVIYDKSPMKKEPFIQAVLKSLHLPLSPNTLIAAHEYANAVALETVLPFAVALAYRYLRERSLDLQADITQYEQFTVVSPLETIQGHAFAMFAKPLCA